MDPPHSPLKLKNTPNKWGNGLDSPKVNSPSTTLLKKPYNNLGHIVNPSHLKNGLEVYILHPVSGIWVTGRVCQVTPDSSTVIVKSAAGEVVNVAVKDLALCSDCDLTTTRDLAIISPLSTPAVLDCLTLRYSVDEIYTGAGSTLIVINPYKVIPGLYSDDIIQRYLPLDQDNQQLGPHIYQTTQSALRGLRYDIGPRSHSIIVSGESGAGKTVSAKHIMKYLVTVARSQSSSCLDIGGRIEQKILVSNPILEAFGNASTLRNDNSSRFGKYIQLQFNRCYEIIGAMIQTYLLEKTRVTHQADGEYNFHVFFQLLQASQDHEVQEMLGVSGNTANYFKFAASDNRDTLKDEQDWLRVRQAFSHIGLSKTNQSNICKVLCSLLHLGNISITMDTEDEDLSMFSAESERSAGIASSLLGVDVSKLEQTLTHKRIAASHRRRQSVFYRPCTSDQATTRRDCLAKIIYARLFEWLVDTINKSIKAEQCHKTIGILDIYGFESFQNNSLEQLCINYANEKLQQHYIVHFLKDLQNEYAREAIPWTFTEFQDNRPCLDMLELNPGLFAILDEECQLNRLCVDEELCGRVILALGASHFVYRARRTNTEFIIKHYAQPVQYNVEGLVDKNRDDIPPEVIELLQQSSEPFIACLFSDAETVQPAGGKKKKCVLAKFKSSLDSLMSTLEQTDPHYVRCIKPNAQGVPGHLDPSFILSQLQACGIIETVEISKQAFPASLRCITDRMLYEDFLQRYGLLLHAHKLPGETSAYNQPHDNKENELLFEPLELLYRKQLQMSDRRKSTLTPKKKIRRRAGLSSADHTRKLSASIMCLVFGSEYMDQPTCSQFGKTKIFLKDRQMEKLESQRVQVLSSHVFTIQCAWRRYRAHKQHHYIQAIIKIQAAVRSFLVRKGVRDNIQAAIRIQRAYRNYMLCKIHRDIQTTDTVLAEFSTPVHCRKDEERTITCGSPRIGAMVSNACIDQAERLDSLPAFDDESPILHQTPYYTPQTSRKVRPNQLDTPHRQKSKFTVRGFQTPPTYPNESPETYVLEAEHDSRDLTYHIIRSPHPKYPGSKPMADVFRNVASAITAAFLTHRRFHLAGAFNGIPYFEAYQGILSRRRLPRVHIKFHTRANRLLRYGHYVHQRELQCSMTDCLLSDD